MFASDPSMEFREGYPILSVSQIVGTLNDVMGEMFPFSWVRGEISGLKRSYAGHYYFTLKDDAAQLSCVCFRNSAERLPFELRDGEQVLCSGNLEIYSERGSLQLIVRDVEPEGAGALALAFEQLKQKLEAEGLFDPARKRPLPVFPRRVGVVTSATGSVIRDILNVSARRHPGIDILIAPTRVQGDGAEFEIVDALRQLAVTDVDVVIVARGGGSLEDLWAFNSDMLAREISGCPVPVVSAVGHETDFTIADFVADMRAPTPSAAAELVFPQQTQWLQTIDGLLSALVQATKRHTQRKRLQLEAAVRALPHPSQKLALQRARAVHAEVSLKKAINALLLARKNELSQLLTQLDAVSPVRVLERGYTMVESAGQPVTRVAQLKPQTPITLKFADGRAQATVNTIDHEGT